MTDNSLCFVWHSVANAERLLPSGNSAPPSSTDLDHCEPGNMRIMEGFLEGLRPCLLLIYELLSVTASAPSVYLIQLETPTL